MFLRGGCLALAGVLALAAGPARAHELVCDKKVNGKKVVEVKSYPTTLEYELTVKNVHPDASKVLEASDPLLEKTGWSFDPPAPFWLPTGGKATNKVTVRLDSYRECVEFAKMADGRDGKDGKYENSDSGGRRNWWNRVWGHGNHRNDKDGKDRWRRHRKAVADNTFTVGWDSGSLECRARVICKKDEPPPPPPPPPPDGEGVATRTMGFFRNRPLAVEECLTDGPIDLGLFTVSSVEEGLGLLHGSVPRFEDRTRRSDLEQKRFLLARQLFVATCNVRMFDTPTTPPTLLADALAALCGDDASAISDYNDLVDAYNNSGTNEDIPFNFGPARPVQARLLAAGNDPTEPGQECPNNL